MTAPTNFLDTVDSYDKLQRLLQERQQVVVMYSAPWCGPCKVMRPKVVRKAEENPDICFVYVDTEKFDDPDRNCLDHVTGLPTFFAYHKRLIVGTFIGGYIDKLDGMISDLNNRRA